MEPDVLRRPLRIILVRHGESKGNVDETLYCHLADSKIPLTPLGKQQARDCGRHMIEMLDGGNRDWKVYFYVSPYLRTLQTLREMLRSFPDEKIAGIREEPRIREQDFGNFQNQESMQHVKVVRDRFGKFFYRFPDGESSADVYDRVSGFLDTLWRDITMSRLLPDPEDKSSDLNIVIVTHGLTMRVLLTRWFKWTTRDFENTINPGNCEVRVMEQGIGGEYSLAVHHDRPQMLSWGLSKNVVEDQMWRKQAVKGQPNSRKPWNYQDFLDELDSRSNDRADESFGYLNLSCRVKSTSSLLEYSSSIPTNRLDD